MSEIFCLIFHRKKFYQFAFYFNKKALVNASVRCSKCGLIRFTFIGSK